MPSIAASQAQSPLSPPLPFLTPICHETWPAGFLSLSRMLAWVGSLHGECNFGHCSQQQHPDPERTLQGWHEQATQGRRHSSVQTQAGRSQLSSGCMFLERDVFLVEQLTSRFGQREGGPQAQSWPDPSGAPGPDLGAYLPLKGTRTKRLVGWGGVQKPPYRRNCHRMCAHGSPTL